MTPTRRRFLELLVSVVVLHTVAIAVYYAIDVAHAATRVQRVFAWIWMGLTVATIILGLQRIKRTRRAARRG
jgi:hypothetical protein